MRNFIKKEMSRIPIGWLCIWFSHAIVCGAGDWHQDQSTNRLYYISDPDVAQIGSAKSQCQTMGAYLVEVNDLAEHTFVTSLLQMSDYWVGMEQENPGVWVWTNAGTAPGSWMPWGAAGASDDTGVRYKLYGGNYELDGRRSPANYYYICELEMSVPCTTFIQPTQTIQVPIPYTVANDVVSYVTQTVNNLMIQTVVVTETATAGGVTCAGNYVPNTAKNFVTIVATVTESANVGVQTCAGHTIAVTETITHTVNNAVIQTVVATVTETTSDVIQPCSTTTGNVTFLTDEDLDKIVKDLQVDKKTTNAYRRTLISADDPRPSAKVVGWVGVVFVVLVFLGLTFMDFIRVVKYLKEGCKSSPYS